MHTPYILPSFNKEAFNCPHCHAYSTMEWERLLYRDESEITDSFIVQAKCVHCNRCSYWYSHPKDAGKTTHGKMISPPMNLLPNAHSEMPADVKADYEEAREIAQHSPRAATALLRMCLQKLCVHLGGTGKDLDADIQALVNQGLPVMIQQALDIVRVIGKNAVRGGEFNSADVATVATSLFELVNHMVEDRIAQPRKLQTMYMNLPQDAPVLKAAH